MIDADFNVPAWALTIADDALAIVPNVELGWLRTKYSRSCGWAGIAVHDGHPMISISAGSNRRDATWVLLHECAHVLTGEGHSVRFWKLLHSMAPAYGIPIEYSVWRNASYAGSLRATEELGHPRLAARMRVVRERDEFKDAEDATLFRQDMRGIRIAVPILRGTLSPVQSAQEPREARGTHNPPPTTISETEILLRDATEVVR